MEQRFMTQGQLSDSDIRLLAAHIAAASRRIRFLLTALLTGAAICMVCNGDWTPGFIALVTAVTLNVLVERNHSVSLKSALAQFSWAHPGGTAVLTGWFTRDAVFQQFGSGGAVSLPLEKISRVDVIGFMWLLTDRNRVRRHAIVFANQLTPEEQKQLLALIRENSPSAVLPMLQ